MRIDYSKRFIKHFKKIPVKIKKAFRDKVDIFRSDKNDESLQKHFLKGEWEGFLSINVTGDWRAIYHELGDGSIEWVEFVEIGTHSQLYK